LRVNALHHFPGMLQGFIVIAEPSFFESAKVRFDVSFHGIQNAHEIVAHFQHAVLLLF